MQKLARGVIGTNNIDNCSRYCQAPAAIGLFGTVGYGGDSGSIRDIEKAGNVLNVLLAPEVSVDFQKLTRHVFASSSCGLCGKATIDAVQGQFPPVQSDLRIDAEIMASLPQQMRTAQETFDRTGGLHAAALFDAAGKMLVLREDVGRHNAVDKVIGHCLLYGPFPPDRHVLLVSGRSSFEIMQKALAARIPIVAAVSAPSSLAATFAQQSGQTLIGFLRNRRMNVYANTQRVSFSARAGKVLAAQRASG
jgi:FdhD protein